MNTLAWLVIAVLMFVFEAITVGLVCIWFSFGALGAFLVSFLTDNIIIELFVFIIVSALSFLFVKPVMKKAMPKKNEESLNKFIGKKGKVIEEINKLGGRVLLGDVSWLAKSLNEETIEKDAIVKVVDLKGNVLIVEKA
ncbi:MAG: NfeD family protein [Lachnospirales bacterium]